MLSFLFNCIKHFGFLNGIDVYLKIKIFKAKSFKLTGYNSPIYLRAQSTDIISFREIFFRKEYDIELPSNFQPKVIIDAGANVGYTSLFFAKKYRDAKIFSLEPEKKNFQVLKKNSEGYAKITPLQMALWVKKGTIDVVDKGYGDRGFAVEDHSDDNSIEGIPCTTIFDLIQENKLSSVDILKIDIEGSEKEVFSYDYDKWLPLTKCLIIELHDRMKEGCSKAVFNAISQYDFSFSLKGENLVFINKNIQSN